MNNEQFTLKANQAIQDSVGVARQNGNQEIVPLHLVIAILSVPENIVSETIKKIGVDPGQLEGALGGELASLPKVQGVYLMPSFGRYEVACEVLDVVERSL